VDLCGGVLIGSVDQAEDFACGFVDPVLQVVDPVIALDGDVGLVRLATSGALTPGMSCMSM
jgi:hypothetical protein